MASTAVLLLVATEGSPFRAQEESTSQQGVWDSVRGESSRACLECHDGSLAPNVLNFPSGPSGNGTPWTFCRLDSPGFNHPIGIDYLSRQAQSGGRLKPIGFALRLENGKIGCVTCHDSASSLPAKLAMSNDRSALCLTCHNL
ncbi:MAG: cytochrome c3 family protein [Thermoplasmata archaeon]